MDLARFAPISCLAVWGAIALTFAPVLAGAALLEEPEKPQKNLANRREMMERDEEIDPDKPRGRLSFGVGGIAQDMFRGTRSSPDGTRTSGFALYPLIVFSADLDLGDLWALSPWLGLTPMSRKGPQDNQATTLVPIAVRASRSINKEIELRAGLGILFYRVEGAGGAMELSNGGSTSTFALPEGSATAKIFFYDLGVGKSFGKIRTDIDILASSVFSSRRSGAAVLSVSFNVL